MNTSKQNLVLYSPYSLEECYTRLKGAVDTSFISSFGSKSVIGSVSKTSIKIRKKIKYRNSFQTVLKASLKSEQNGTLISGYMDSDAFVKIFMYIWFGTIIIIGGLIFIVTLASLFLKKTIAPNREWIGVIIFPVMIGFGIGLFKFGKYLARDESKYLKVFLIELLDAKEDINIDFTCYPTTLPAAVKLRVWF